MKITDIKSFPMVYNYIRGYYGDDVHLIEDIPIVKLDKKEWGEYKLKGDGYFVKSDQFREYGGYIERCLRNQFLYDTLPTDEHKRDVNLYRIQKEAGGDAVIVIRSDNEEYLNFVILHEIAHIVYKKDKKEFPKINFDDEYLDDQGEQFVRFNEIRFAQEMSLDFDSYFEKAFPVEHEIIKKYENGDNTISRRNYNLCQMDKRDYKKMWDAMLNNAGQNKNSFNLIKMKKIATAVVTKEEIQGKYGKFTAYTVSGDTRPISQQLKNLGFRWYGLKQVWWISDKKVNESILHQLENLGLSFTDTVIQKNKPVEQPPIPLSQTQTLPPKETVYNTRAKNYNNGRWVTEDEKRSKYNKFPINIKEPIAIFNVSIPIEKQKQDFVLKIFRDFVPGTGSGYGSREWWRNSAEHRGFPRYILKISDEDNTVASYNKLSKKNTEQLYGSSKPWGSYNEEELLVFLKDNFVKSIEASDNAVPDENGKILKSNLYRDISKYLETQKRTPEFAEYLKFVEDNKPPDKFIFHVEDTKYAGDYEVWPEIYGARSNNVSINVRINSPFAYGTIGERIGHIDINGVYTIENFKNKVQSELNTNPEFKENLINRLKSIPYLPEEIAEQTQKANEIWQILKNNDYDQVLQELKIRGYIRPRKIKKELAPGLVPQGNDIKWIIDSKKIVDDYYGRLGDKNMDFFYPLIAYYVHRKVRRIESWTDMMLTDGVSSLERLFKHLGIELPKKKFGYVDVIPTVDDPLYTLLGKMVGSIISNIGGDIEEDQQISLSDPGLNDFVAFSQEFGIDPGDAKENVYATYRALVKLLHPDKYQDLGKKQEMQEKFQALQSIWSEIPTQYKQAFNLKFFKIS